MQGRENYHLILWREEETFILWEAVAEVGLSVPPLVERRVPPLGGDFLLRQRGEEKIHYTWQSDRHSATLNGQNSGKKGHYLMTSGCQSYASYN